MTQGGVLEGKVMGGEGGAPPHRHRDTHQCPCLSVRNSGQAPGFPQVVAPRTRSLHIATPLAGALPGSLLLCFSERDRQLPAPRRWIEINDMRGVHDIWILCRGGGWAG